MAEKNAKYFKTKDGTIVVCKDEFARQQIEQLQGIWEAIEELPDGQAVSAQVAIHTTEIAALQSGKANINGSYDSMTVGMAKNVEGTSSISGIFIFRPTAGNGEIASGVARVLKIGGNAMAWNQLYDSAVPTAVTNHKYFCKEYNSGVERNEIVLAANLVSWFTDGSANRNVIDLTLMFGAGNEPATPEAFEAWLQANVGLQTYYPYNAGELLSAKLLGLRTVGLNQWDEQWESGNISNNDGSNVTATNRWRSSYIPVIGGRTYYFACPTNPSKNINLFAYDANKNFIATYHNGWVYGGSNSSSNVTGLSIQVPNNCSYLRIKYGSTDEASYQHDICINLHYTNGRDGEYEPYVEHQYNFDTSKVYGKLNGEGELVQIFPDGMKSAGSARDELTIKDGVAKVIKRVGSVDLGDLTWNYYSGLVVFTAPQIKGDRSLQGICQAYTYQAGGHLIDKNFSISSSHYGISTGLVIKDTSYSDAATFKAAMNGVMLYYELAEPAEYTDLVYRDNGVDTPISALNILVSNYGTEEQIVESPTNGEPNSCAATLDILYGVNAADFMDAANNGAFVSKASLDALCNTLGSALGGTLTSTWNSAEGHYDFTFTPATRQIENPENNE